ncbi:Cbp1 family collagen-binding glycoprotein adhesin [Mangrovibacterium lignilyticum]|uniref:Cbp1 family collagen-binding glycoprotein adhesin n=1 Tax=Mangrovibacterium lignilyticum TaxID=2668052 RepID=UPI0013D345BC|nr:hypothetical protein [Mangrovibacterium lignilyticum]
MRKLIYLCALVLTIVSCQQGKIKQMQATQDSLAQAAVEKDSAIVNFVSAMTAIQDNLDSIKQMEDIVRIESAKVSEGKPSDKDHILSDIEIIHQLMIENKELINKLQKQLGSSNAKVAQLQKAIVVLNRQIEQKDADIAELNTQVEQLHLDITGLNTRIDEMTAEGLRKDEVLQEKTSTIESQTIAINTAFYAFGSQKELIENDLVEKAGGFLGIGKSLKMKEDFNRAYFTEIDIREFSSLELHAKKAKLVTTHPAGSYHFEGEDVVESLVIDDPQEFWRTSKFLIVVVD